MTPRELHDDCENACSMCPQFYGWDNDSIFPSFGEFGKIPDKGLLHTINFWREYGDLLWDSGYDAELSEESRAIFE